MVEPAPEKVFNPNQAGMPESVSSVYCMCRRALFAIRAWRYIV